MGVIVDGCPAGLPIDKACIQKELDKRRGGQSAITTNRKEPDKIEILSGLFNGFTNGAPICMLVWNISADSSPYEEMIKTPRPGHADYTAWVKYGGYNDHRGGGRFSGRITIGYVAAGYIAKTLLRTLGIEVLAHTIEIGGIKAKKMDIDEIRNNRKQNRVCCGDIDAAKKMVKAIHNAHTEGDSVGGIIECITLNCLPGVGEPVFDTLEGDISKALFSIPAVKAVEFGAGFDLARKRGSECNDEYFISNGMIVTKTNNSGGILGGISNGMPIVCRVLVKPTPSIQKKQKTVDLENMSMKEIEVKGRHDPCIVPRAIPVIEGMVAVVLADHSIRAGLIPRVFKNDNDL